MSGTIGSISGDTQFNPAQRVKAAGTEPPETGEDSKKSVLEQMREDTVEISEEARALSREKRALDNKESAAGDAEESGKEEDQDDNGSWAVTELVGDPDDPSSVRSRVVAQGKGALPPGYGGAQ